MGVIATAAAGTALAGLGTALHGAYYRNSFVFGEPVTHLRTRERAVALTFDDGPNPVATPAILDALGARGVKATFFILGRHAKQWPALVRRVVDEGHVVANHGFYHRKLHIRTPGYVRTDLELGTQMIVEACGVHPLWFRAPHGFRSPWVTSIAKSLGQRTVGWSLGVWDSARPGVDAIVTRTISGARPGAILLLHDGDGYDDAGDRMQTAQAIPGIIDRLHESGYRFSLLDAA